MSAPQLPTCPPWCREDHRLQQTRHRRNVDEVPRAAGNIEVEVNLCQDDMGAFVQLVVSDYGIPVNDEFAELRHVFYRMPLDLAGAWAHVATEMDARGALMVGQHIEHALEIFREARSCLFEWCVSDHSDPEWATSHISASGGAGGLSAVRLLVEPEDVGLVQINFTPGNSYEFTPAAALDLADILDLVGGDKAAAMAAVIHSLASLPPTGVGE